MPRVEVRVSVDLVYRQEVPLGRIVESAVRNALDLEDWFASLPQTTVPGDGPAALEVGPVGHMRVRDDTTGEEWAVSFDPDTGTINRIRH